MSYLDIICQQLDMIANDSNQWSASLNEQARRMSLQIQGLARSVKQSNSFTGRQAIAQLQIAIQKLESASRYLLSVEKESHNWIATTITGGNSSVSVSHHSIIDDSNSINNEQMTEWNNSSMGNLAVTTQTWTSNEDGTLTFDSPIETGITLDAEQGKVLGFDGTCGLVSCVNVLRMAGINISEQQIISYASKNGLCVKGHYNSGNNGCTTARERKDILAKFGMQSELMSCSVESIASAVCEGRGVIASFDAGRLWNDPDYYGAGHAVTITSAKMDSAGNIIGFYVCDSGTGGIDKAKYYSTGKINYALTGRPINVTSIIR